MAGRIGEDVKVAAILTGAPAVQATDDGEDDEFRQDLIAEEAGQRAWAARLARWPPLARLEARIRTLPPAGALSGAGLRPVISATPPLLFSALNSTR